MEQHERNRELTGQAVTIKATGVAGEVYGSLWNHKRGEREYLVQFKGLRTYKWYLESELMES